MSVTACASDQPVHRVESDSVEQKLCVTLLHKKNQNLISSNITQLSEPLQKKPPVFDTMLETVIYKRGEAIAQRCTKIQYRINSAMLLAKSCPE